MRLIFVVVYVVLNKHVHSEQSVTYSCVSVCKKKEKTKLIICSWVQNVSFHNNLNCIILYYDTPNIISMCIIN